MRTAPLQALLLTLFLPAAVLAQPACPEHFLNGQPPALRNVRLGERTHLLCNDAFASLASGVTRGALWAAERLTADSIAAAGMVERVNRFFGYGAVERLQVRQGAARARAPQPAAAPPPITSPRATEGEVGASLRAIADPELRACLEALAQQVSLTVGAPEIPVIGRVR